MSFFPNYITEQAAFVVTTLAQKKATLVLAESCTGGLLAAAITDIAGASTIFTHGWITYANEAKTSLLGVLPALLNDHGAVSAEVACAMADGARDAAVSDYALAITGIAGPSGGSSEKPVGLVYIACAHPAGTEYQRHVFSGGRSAVRMQAVEAALALIRTCL